MDARTFRLAGIIWDYHQLGQQPVPADVMIVFGTNDLRVAGFAAGLHAAGFGKRMVCTGGMAHTGDMLATGWTRTEAEVFAEEAIRRGVSREAMLLESRALNTAENIRFTRELLAQRAIKPRNVLLVCKPFMQRRVWATMAVEWPEMPATVVSQKMTLEEYFTPELPPERVIPVMMGDLQRIWIYGAKGWSAPQQVPEDVMEAYGELVRLGFTQHLIAEDGETG